MSVTTLKTDEPDIDFPEFGDGDGNPRCMWDEGVCSETVEYRLVRNDERNADGEFGLALSFCPRHYLLTLAELVELHVPNCNGRLSDHLGGFGRWGLQKGDDS